MWTITPEPRATLFHYSEDPAIARFVPHVPPTNPSSPPYVWAVEARYAALYFFPRACPRVTVWGNDALQRARLQELFETERERVHFAPRSEREATRACVLYEYVFEPGPFTPWQEAEGQWVAATPIEPLRCAPVGELQARQEAAGVDLRWTDDLAAARSRVLESGLPFSIVRYRNYRPHLV
ncbi:MAG: DUF6886 family protein [Polyangiales bacterium]